MRCRSCGAKLPRDAVYCYNCGAYIKRRPTIKLFTILAALAVSSMLLLYPASPLSVVGKHSSPVLDRLVAAGFEASVNRDGYVVVKVENPSVIDLASLERVLDSLDRRWVVVWNGVEKGSEDKAAMLADVLKGFDGVAGAHVTGGVVTVSMDSLSAQTLHTVFKLAGKDVALFIRFI